MNWLPAPLEWVEAGGSGSVTVQSNVPTMEVPVYGYHHNEKAEDHKEAMMDYFTEMEDPFERRDNVLGYPLPNHDILSVSGEGIGGTFRPFRSEFGHYRNNHVYSDDISVNSGVDFGTPSVVGIPPFIVNLNTSIGYSLSGDYHWTEIGAWKNLGDAKDFGFSDDAAFPNSQEKFFYAFSNDMGGKFQLSNAEPAAAIPYVDGMSSVNGIVVEQDGINYIAKGTGNNLPPPYGHWRALADEPFQSDLIGGFNNASIDMSKWQGLYGGAQKQDERTPRASTLPPAAMPILLPAVHPQRPLPAPIRIWCTRKQRHW